MKARNCFVYVGMFTCQFLICTSEFKPLNMKIVPGIYLEEKLPLIPYETAVPMVFEFKLKPELWNVNFQSAGRLRVVQRLACRSDNKTSNVPSNYADYSFTCPVFFHMYNYLRQFKVNYTDIHPTTRSLARAIGENQVFSNPDIVSDDCDSFLSRKWAGVNSRDYGFADYKLALEKCNLVASYIEDQILDYSYDTGPTIDQMRDNFALNFAANLSIASTSAASINNLLALQGTHLINFYAEITRFREAVLSCQNQMIPLSFLGAARFDKAITSIRGKLLKTQYALSISALTQLYKMPIADCIYGNSILLVRILLPVVRKTTSFKLFKVHYPQFLYKMKTSESANTTHALCQVLPKINSASDYVLFDRTLNYFTQTDCRPHDRKLCHIPNKSDNILLNKCIYSVLQSSYAGIQRFCSLTFDEELLSATELNYKALPLIRNVSPSKFIITLNRITSILIKCEGFPDTMIAPQDFGAVEVILACNCYIAYHDQTYYAKSPCSNKLSVAHVIPDHMVRKDLPLLQRNGEFAPEEVEKILNLNFTSSASFEGNNSSKQNQLDLQREVFACESNHLSLWIFIVCQFFVVCFSIILLCAKVYALKKRLEYGRNAICCSVSNLDDRCNEKL